MDPSTSTGLSSASTTPEVSAAPRPQRPAQAPLSVTRLNVLRAGYLFMAAGLTVKKWPLPTDAADRPLYESVTICIPWPHVWRSFVRTPGDPWRRG